MKNLHRFYLATLLLILSADSGLMMQLAAQNRIPGPGATSDLWSPGSDFSFLVDPADELDDGDIPNSLAGGAHYWPPVSRAAVRIQVPSREVSVAPARLQFQPRCSQGPPYVLSA